MKCPICKEVFAYHSLLEAQLPAYQCRKCEGIWISANEYLRWLKTQPTPLPEKPAGEDTLQFWDVPVLKLCPNCGHFLIRYRVLPHVELYLDRCGSCNGVWFDRNEWDVLVARNLHDKVNLFFTRPWQTKIRAEEARARLDQIYLERLGAADYARVKELRDWLQSHPLRGALLAFLQSDDPYAL